MKLVNFVLFVIFLVIIGLMYTNGFLFVSGNEYEGYQKEGSQSEQFGPLEEPPFQVEPQTFER